MIEIKEVNNKKLQKEFLNFPLKLYKDNKYYVPPIYLDEKQIFSKNYVYAKTTKSVFYLAYLDNKVVGRISGIIQYASNNKWNQKRVRFTRFDCIDNQDVANALFNAIEDFALSNNMEEIVGPLGYSDLEREGLLIEGFDQVQTYEEQYNYDYYQKLIENYGFFKEVDWLEHQIRIDSTKKDRIINLSEKVLKRFNLHVVKKMSVSKYLKIYGDQFFKILDETYKNIYGTVPFTEDMKKNIISGFKLITNKDYLGTIVDKDNNIVAFSVAFPSIGNDLIKSQGHLTIPTIFKLIKTIKKPKTIDLGLVGVIEKYQGLGVSSNLFALLIKDMEEHNIEYCETNLTLETNYHIINQFSNFKVIHHKKRRCFIKKVKGNA